MHPAVLPLPVTSLLPDDLVAYEPQLTLPEARRLLSIAHRTGELPATTPAGIRRQPYLSVRDRLHMPNLLLRLRRESQCDPFVKYAFESTDGTVIESVRIPLERPNRFVVCVSSQAGCGLGCAFCATGKMGLGRNLLPWEIIEQVRQVRSDLPVGGRVHGVVFQGMGEPLANVAHVVQSVRVMSDPSLLAIDARAITVCTAGLSHPLPRLLEALPNVRVGVSIGSALAHKRRALMPIEASQPLEGFMKVLAGHARATRIAPMWAYTLLRGVNDSDDDVVALCELARSFVQAAGVKPRVSLLRYNPTGEGDGFQVASDERVEAFRAAVGALGVPVVRRYSGGADIGAACGQLGRARMAEETSLGRC